MPPPRPSSGARPPGPPHRRRSRSWSSSASSSGGPVERLPEEQRRLVPASSPTRPLPQGVNGADGDERRGACPTTPSPASPRWRSGRTSSARAARCSRPRHGADVEKLADEGKVNLVWRPTTFLDARLRGHQPEPQLLARGGVRLGLRDRRRQGEEYHYTVFANQPANEGDGYTDAQLLDFGKQAGITGDAYTTFATCVTTSHLRAVGRRTPTRPSSDDGVPGTPTAYLNGTEVPARDAADDMTALARRSSPRPRRPDVTTCSPRSRARRKGSGTSGRSRSGRTRCASSPASSSRSGRRPTLGRARRPCPGSSPTSRCGRCRSASSAAGSTTSSPTGQIYFGPTARAAGRRCRIWDGGLGIWGAVVLGGVGAWIGVPAPGHPAAAVRRRDRPGHRARPGHGPLGQLVQPGAVRPPDRPALGPGDRPRAPSGRLRAVRDLPPDVPLRVDLVRRRRRWS